MTPESGSRRFSIATQYFERLQAHDGAGVTALFTEAGVIDDAGIKALQQPPVERLAKAARPCRFPGVGLADTLNSGSHGRAVHAPSPTVRGTALRA